jgi:cell division protein FtsA
VIDDQNTVDQPIGLEAAKLSLHALVIHGVRARLNNIEKVVSNVPVTVVGSAFSGLCSALSVLSDEQRKAGVVMLDMGGGKTDYVVYADGAVALAGSLGVGGDHVTNDIAHAFSIPIGQAEILKRQYGSAVVQEKPAAVEAEVPPDGGFPGRRVKVRSLQAVMNARLDELLLILRKKIEAESLIHHIAGGVVVTGGGARIRELDRLVEKVFGMPMTVGLPRHVSGVSAAIESPEYAACTGLVQHAFMEQRRRRPSILGTLWDMLAGGS